MKILSIIPGKEKDLSNMVFAKRQVEYSAKQNIQTMIFHLEARNFTSQFFSELKRLNQTLNEFKPDIIHAHYGTITSFVASLFSHRAKLIVTYRGCDLNFRDGNKGVPFLKKVIGHLMSQFAALLSSKVICVSQGLKDKLWFKRSSAVILPDGVPSDVFKPRDKTEMRKRLNLPQDKHILIFNAGSDPEVKRLDLAEKVVEILKDKQVPVHFFVISGNLAPQEIPLLLSAADCLLVTSDSEGSPLITKEALSTNLPIVSVPVGDIPEMVDEVKNCFIVDRNPDLLADKVFEIFNNKEPSNGRDFLYRYDIEQLSKKLVEIYRSMIS